MSRIYEALQKAESERTSGAQPDRSREAAESRSSPYSAAVAEYDPPPAQTAPERYESRQEPPAGSSEFEQIPTRPWSPSLAQLPSLMERGAAVEQFRSLRSRIYELRNIRPLKSILISSGLPREGKSFVAANLAVSLARNRHSRVLLIDGDLRRSTLHQLLGCPSEPGLAEYLSGKIGMVEAMQRPELGVESNTPGIRAEGMPAITLIAGGDAGDRAADLSNQPKFKELIAAASQMFDWIIVDSSPVIPVSDAVNLARACDGVLLVARSGVTQFAQAQQAQNELRASNILGFVLNAIDTPPSVGHYYGYGAKPE